MKVPYKKKKGGIVRKEPSFCHMKVSGLGGVGEKIA